jgi:hypothetical protein
LKENYIKILIKIILYYIKKKDVQIVSILSTLPIINNLKVLINKKGFFNILYSFKIEISFKLFKLKYSEILYKFNLLEERIELLKIINQNEKSNNDSVLDVKFEKNINILKCSICRISVKGLTMLCFKCFHGGHLSHINNWFKNNKKCLNCDCNCDFNQFINYDSLLSKNDDFDKSFKVLSSSPLNINENYIQKSKINKIY